MKEGNREKVILWVTALLSSVQDMTLIIPYQSITIISYARVVLPPSVCFGSKHQSQIRAPACLLSSTVHVCPAHYISNHLYYSVVSLWPIPSLFIFSFHHISDFFLDDSTSQALPSKTSLLLSNVKSISQLVNVGLVLWLSFRLLTHTITHSHIHGNTYVFPHSPSIVLLTQNQSLNTEC